jgi:hypothetical protein
LYVLLLFPFGLFGQFDGIVGSEGCKAIHCKDSRIISWATECEVIRGYQDIAKPENGYASYGTEVNATGTVTDSNALDVVSLGDGGVAILRFQTPIVDGEGYDFAVFENSFDDSFLELAFVEASSDGVHYFRFPATSNTPVEKQVNGFGKLEASHINNLAGKYRIGWGTPFDLEELTDDPNLDKNNIRYIKIIDVVGTIDSAYATYDANGNIVNDPYPTNFASGGFDLSGVGGIHDQNNTSINKNKDEELFVSVYPNPCNGFVYIQTDESVFSLYNSMGQKLMEQSLRKDRFQINISEYPAGVYFVNLRNNQRMKTIKLIKQ